MFQATYAGLAAPWAARRWVMPLVFGVLVLLAASVGAAAAASFDCGHPGAVVERLICGNPNLSVLDDSLAGAYARAISAGDNADAVRAARAWLRDVRNRCADAGCVADSHRSRITAPTHVSSDVWKHFRDPHLGLAFDYPPGWVARPGCHDSKDCVAVFDDSGSVNAYRIAFEIFDGPLAAVAPTRSALHQAGETWVASGRYAALPAKTMEGKGWTGVRAVVGCGVTSGGQSISSDCLWVAASDGQRTVIVDTQGLTAINDDIDRMVRSLRLRAPKASCRLCPRGPRVASRVPRSEISATEASGWPRSVRRVA